jgi:hypothetical protein
MRRLDLLLGHDRPSIPDAALMQRGLLLALLFGVVAGLAERLHVVSSQNSGICPDAA